jgi:branched-chain amino acid aminotransferase
MADTTTIEPATGSRPAPAGDPAYRDGVAFVDGAFVPVLEATVPMLDWGFLRSDACQDTISVWKGSFFRLEQHLERFERSYTRLRMTCPYSRDQLREIATELVRRAGFRDAYVQLIMTRGRPPVGSRDPRQCRNRFQAFCIPYVWIATPEVQERGLRLHISPRLRVPPRVVDPTIKHYHWLDFEQGLFEAFDTGAETVVLLGEDGNVAEGPGFNVFAVKGGRVTTPAEYVLDGMTRTVVIELCEEDGIPLTLGTIAADELRGADEVFISTTAGGVIPVTVVDGKPIGDGKPGPVTRRLKSLYWSKREAGWHATPIDYDR